MILKRLHIENFGKLSNLDIDFDSSLNQLLKDNGWGKSTLTVFIKAMFYGMSAKTRGEDYKSERSRFMPWQGGVYGGYIDFQTKEGSFRVTRTFGKTPEGDSYELFDYKNNKVTKEEREPLGNTLFGISEDSFKMTAFFPQLNFRSSSNSELTASLTGVNKYEDDLKNIDSAIKKLNEKRLDIKRQIPKKTEIEEKHLQISHTQALRRDIQEQIQSQETVISDLENNRSLLQEKVELEKQKLSIQEEKYKNKTLIEGQVQNFTSSLASLYAKQNQFQSKALENIKSQRSNLPKKMIFISLPLLVAVIVAMAVLYIANIVNLPIFLAVAIVSVVLIAVLTIIYFKKYKDTKTPQAQQNLVHQFNDELGQLEAKLAELKSVLAEKYSSVEMPNREKLDSLQYQLNNINIECITQNNKLNSLKNQLEASLNQEDYLISQYEALKDNLATSEEKYTIVEKTIDYLLQARDNVATRYVSSINSEFSEILQEFSIDPNRFVIDNQWKVKEQTTIGTKDFEYSSQGYQDIISFCQRISLINKIYKKERPFIILDDTFVNLDDNMMKCAKEITKELSKNYQIIYVCCHSRCSMLD